MPMRPFAPGDRDRMLDLLATCRAAGFVAQYPTAWRVQLLLDSRVWDVAQDVRLWEDAAGRTLAWALLWRRRPDDAYLALERALDPGAADDRLHESVLDWAADRTAAAAAARQTSVALVAAPLERDAAQDVRRLERHGLARIPHAHNVYMAAPLHDAPAPPTLPDGFRLGPLAEADLPRYQAAFGFTPVSDAHQRELLHNPEYQHFIAAAPDGTIAGCLECSFWRAEWSDAAPRTGWIDYVQTQPDHLRRGLGRALTATGLAHLHAHGVERAMLITRHDNAAAQTLFRRAGLTFAADEYMYRREFHV